MPHKPGPKVKRRTPPSSAARIRGRPWSALGGFRSAPWAPVVVGYVGVLREPVWLRQVVFFGFVGGKTGLVVYLTVG